MEPTPEEVNEIVAWLEREERETRGVRIAGWALLVALGIGLYFVL